MKKVKFSIGFERDFEFYKKNTEVFNFCGTLNPKYEAIADPDGLTAKECFFFIESKGINLPCSESILLNNLLLTKASINFQIKQWAEGRADGTLPLIEFSKRTALLSKNSLFMLGSSNMTLSWVNNEPVYFTDIETQYELPEWVVEAVEKQKFKFYKMAS
jgi:hypothetical protein